MSKDVGVTELDYEYIAEQIKQGMTSGNTGDGEGNRISWSLDVNKWED